MTARAGVRPALAASLLREGRAVEMPLGGASMRPLFAPGDTLHIEPATVAHVTAGDVVVLDLDGNLLVHRLIYKTASAVVTRGDDSPSSDPPHPLASLIGRVPIPPSPLSLYATVRALLRR
jgi:phage repressor protein C with HTH and peptisase S24 domain